MNEPRDPFVDVDHYTKERLAGIDMCIIRKAFLDKGYAEEEVRSFMRMIERTDHRKAKADVANSQTIYFIGAGSVLLGIGAVVSYATYFKALNAGGGVYVVLFGSILTGIGMILRGATMRTIKRN